MALVDKQVFDVSETKVKTIDPSEAGQRLHFTKMSADDGTIILHVSSEPSNLSGNVEEFMTPEDLDNLDLLLDKLFMSMLTIRGVAKIIRVENAPVAPVAPAVVK